MLKKCSSKSDTFSFSLSGWVLELSKPNNFYIKMFVWMRRIFYMHLTTKFQRLWSQKQAQRYLSSKNRVFHVYDSPTLTWLALSVLILITHVSGNESFVLSSLSLNLPSSSEELWFIYPVICLLLLSSVVYRLTLIPLFAGRLWTLFFGLSSYWQGKC